MSAFFFMNMHIAITNNVTLEESTCLKVRSSIAQMSVGNNIQTYSFVCNLYVASQNYEVLFLQPIFLNSILEMQERIKLPLVWVTMGMWWICGK